MKSYGELPIYRGIILDVLAVLYMPVGTGKIFNVLNALKVKDDKNRLANHGSLVAELKALMKLGLAEQISSRYRCARPVVELIARHLMAEGRFAAIESAVRKEIAYEKYWSEKAYFDSEEHMVANVRLPFYCKDLPRLNEVLHDVFTSDDAPELSEHPISAILRNPFDADWLDSYPAEDIDFWMAILLQDVCSRGEACDEIAAYARQVLLNCDPETDVALTITFVLGEIAFLRGEFDIAEADSEFLPELYGGMLAARCQLVSGKTDQAVAGYEASLSALKSHTRKRKPKFETADWPLFVLAHIDGGAPPWKTARELAQWGVSDRAYTHCHLCVDLVKLIKKESGAVAPAPSQSSINWRDNSWRDERSILAKYIWLLVDFWMGRKVLEESGPEIERLYKKLGENGYRWLEAEFAELLHRIGATGEDYAARAASLRDALGTRPLADIVQPTSDWERALRALTQLEVNKARAAGGESASRLIWVLANDDGHWSLQPKEQKRSAAGRWSKGRNIALKRLYEEVDKLDFLTDQDRAACRKIDVEQNRGYWGRGDTSYILPMTVLKTLVGHPNVILGKTGGQVDLVAAEPELRVSKSKGGFTLSLVPPKPEYDTVYVEAAGDTRVVVYEYTPEICRVAEILGGGVSIPEKAKGSVLEAVGNVAGLVTIHSDIGIGDESVPRVDTDSTPVLQMLPSGDGLLVQLRVQPLREGGPLFPPGGGGEVVIAEVNGARVQTRRDFAAEKQNADAVIAACPTLAGTESWESEWQLPEPEDCLELLTEIAGCDLPARIQWPKGERYKVLGTAGAGQFRLNIKGGHNWFEVSGEVKVDEGLVLDMGRLLELTGSTRSRFIELDNGQFVALTQAFRKKLDELRGLGDRRDGQLRLHALAAPVMDDLVAQAAGVKANKNWKQQVQRLQKARDLEPELPSTLRATLRDYQVDGFKWLARLAEWGVGACLADDMGLGKTVQILAVMLGRASGGPQLVVAPTSVCNNWVVEAIRFAPTLQFRPFGTGDREALMADLGPFDVVVTSYGLLQSEIDRFKSVEWQTIVLDEAQAIKNMATKRSKAVMELNGDFRIAATGTPIENHLGELWNLSRFINPGFLGSMEHFNKRFAIPIEKNQDRETRHHLKQLIQPFILRRLKEDVLDELPPRTDIVLHVELGKEERAFYEALRIRALKQLSDVKAAPGKHHVRILAEIMRLRRACCNTRLVDGGSALPSSKLEVVEALLDELMENRHKALVFSQFVDHLSIVRELLDKKGVTYQYLDGSTPPKARTAAVNAFQAGEGDLFLISLKAGGLGLNLTAADYVIHMDPWWNPAVEDQASDRAHRIGQQRPVTVYRLVARDTIEDQIVDLHHQKRDLANSLLDGSDMAGKITAEQLLALLQND